MCWAYVHPPSRLGSDRGAVQHLSKTLHDCALPQSHSSPSSTIMFPQTCGTSLFTMQLPWFWIIGSILEVEQCKNFQLFGLSWSLWALEKHDIALGILRKFNVTHSEGAGCVVDEIRGGVESVRFSEFEGGGGSRWGSVNSRGEGGG